MMREAYKTNILEEEVFEKIDAYGNKSKVFLNPYEIGTVKTVLD
ncbi:MAG: hypothetical protein ACUVQY_08725 [Thermoproteota archaeon]